MKDLAEKRSQQLREHTAHANAGGVRSSRSGRDPRDLCAARHQSPSGSLWGLPKDPQIPLMVRIWKGPLKWLGNFAITAGILAAAAHYVLGHFGPKTVDGDKRREESK